MINIIGDVIPAIKQDLAKEINVNININELAKQLYPILLKLHEQNPQTKIRKHNEFLSKCFGTNANKDFLIIKR